MDHSSPPTARTWTVLRQDDLGNQFVVETGLTRDQADRLVEMYHARGHKQLYWAEPETDSIPRK